MKKGLPANRRGYTLIELLVVCVMLALFSLTLIGIFLATFRAGAKASIIQQLHQDGDSALQAMTRELKRAQAVVCNPDTLELTPLYLSNRIIYQLSGGKIASDSSDLTGGLGTASNLSFSCVDTSAGGQIITINFTLTHELISQNFATSVSTRQR